MIKRLALAAVAALMFALVAPSPASAQHWQGRHRGWERHEYQRHEYQRHGQQRHGWERRGWEHRRFEERRWGGRHGPYSRGYGNYPPPRPGPYNSYG